MDQIKTTTETIITNGNDTWENLGDVTLYRRNFSNYVTAGSATLLFKYVPGLGKRFKVVYNGIIYSLEKNPIGYIDNSCNAYIGAISRYLNVEGYE